MKIKNILLIIISLTFFSCVDDEINSVYNPPVVQNYDLSESSQCMTLASLSYVNENNPAYLKDSLIIQLSDTSYSTNGFWKLAWGPSLSPDGGNMMFVVKDSTTVPVSYCIVVRGTDWCFPFNWKEDLGAIEFDWYPWGGSEDSISHGALEGLNTLLAMRDSVTNKTLFNFLIDISTQSKQQMYITGHSLGGMLATVLSAYFLDNGFYAGFNLNTYTFAAPSAGNQQFADHYKNKFAYANAESYRVVNPNDLVHYFYSDLNTVLINQIPTTLPYEIDAVIVGIELYFKTYNMFYKHVGERYPLPVPQVTGCSFTPGSIDQYECYVAFNHSTNTYLSLLGSPITNVGYVACNWIDP